MTRDSDDALGTTSAAVAEHPDADQQVTVPLPVVRGDKRSGRAGYVSAARVVAAVKEAESDADSELWLYDPGYTSTACCRSRITYIDGERGVLEYRGYPIEQLAERVSYADVVSLLLDGELPGTPTERRQLLAALRPGALPESMAQRLCSFAPDAHPMTALMSCVASLTALYPQWNPSLVEGDGGSLRVVYGSAAQRRTVALTAMQSVAALAAAILRHRRARAPSAAAAAVLTAIPVREPNRTPSVAAAGADDDDDGNADDAMETTFGAAFLRAAWADDPDAPTGAAFTTLADAMDTLFVLHADHELNCSTAAMRHLTSSGADVFTCLAAAIGALYGPLHGGANEAVLKMLADIGDVGNVDAYVESVKRQERKLMGFGHRVYRSYDPRAKIVRQLAHQVLAHRRTRSEGGSSAASAPGDDPLLQVAQALEERALHDDYFVQRHLYPNVDFYSGVVYRAMGFPPEYFPVLFAVGRSAGWLAHWSEMLEEDEHAATRKIVRPRQIYIGPRRRTVPRLPADNATTLRARM